MGLGRDYGYVRPKYRPGFSNQNLTPHNKKWLQLDPLEWFVVEARRVERLPTEQRPLRARIRRLFFL
jgi:hypothetical protein